MIKPLCCFAFLTLIIGCATGAPPNAFERQAYNVTTNWVTNVVAQVVFGPSNNIISTNYYTHVEPRYQFDPKPEVVTAVQTAGTVATTFGFGAGGIIASILLGAYGAYAKWQSNRRGTLNEVLVNNVQLARATILSTAGQATEAHYVDSISSAQVKAGVKKEAMAVVESNVDEKEAREEAAGVVSLAKATPAVP